MVRLDKIEEKGKQILEGMTVTKQMDIVLWLLQEMQQMIRWYPTFLRPPEDLAGENLSEPSLTDSHQMQFRDAKGVPLAMHHFF